MFFQSPTSSCTCRRRNCSQPGLVKHTSSGENLLLEAIIHIICLSDNNHNVEDTHKASQKKQYVFHLTPSEDLQGATAPDHGRSRKTAATTMTNVVGRPITSVGCQKYARPFHLAPSEDLQGANGTRPRQIKRAK